MGAGLTPAQKSAAKQKIDRYIQRQLLDGNYEFNRIAPAHYTVTREGATVTVQASWIHASNGEAALLVYIQGQHSWEEFNHRLLYALTQVRQANEKANALREGKKILTTYEACGIIEGFDPRPNQTEEDVVEAFQSLIDSGIVWQLQGFYGRTAAALIQAGKCHN